MKHLLRFLLILFVLPAGIVRAQDEPLLEELTRAFKKEYLSLGILFQAVGDFQVERNLPGNNGFNISNMRIILSGELDGGFGYLFKTNFIKSPAILDAKAYYRISPSYIIDVGLFKPAFSKEYLTGAGSIDFVNRAQVVTALAGSRQLGAQIRGAFADRVWTYGIGVFNGNGFGGNVNDNNDFMLAGRIEFSPKIAGGVEEYYAEIGFGAVISNDRNASIGGGVLPLFDGKRTLVGGDARFTAGKILMSAEMIGGSLEHRGGNQSNPLGYHATVGYMASTTTQLLLRWDAFQPDGLAPNSNLFILGFNLWPTAATGIQINYVVPSNDTVFKHHQLLLNAQLAF